jgi:multidrug resistance efflux pump
MSQEQSNTKDPESVSSQAPEATAETPIARDPVKRWTMIVLIITVLLLTWYLRSDRVTPYTSQARVHGLVVPIAAEVSGIVTAVEVQGNQLVEQGQVLLTIETDSYELAVQNAEAVLQSARDATGASESNIEAARAGVASAQAALIQSRQDAERMRKIRERSEAWARTETKTHRCSRHWQL